MRAVVFSDPSIRKILDALFVCTWKDLERDPQSGSSPRVRPGDHGVPLPRGRGFSNLQMVVLTPDAKLIHLVAGTIDARDLEWELAQALITYEAAKSRPQKARSIVVWRQDRIMDQFAGIQRYRARGGFGITPAPREMKTEWHKPAPAHRRSVDKQRKIVKRFALAPEHKIQTRWLTRGISTAGFPGNEVLESRPAPVVRAPQRPPEKRRPLPWNDMPDELRERFAAALGVTPPATEKPTSAKKKAPRRSR